MGHWPDSNPFGARRIDGIRVTGEVVPALRRLEVTHTDLAKAVSDHLPVTVTYESADLA
ncbi:hypothetical protein [Candidatus Protofrankia californiensis]|uniref:hypothetical protein n=1 Tax=Candidatus Protofrankia californiensis TaxID=1839754 RepID=UPI0013EDB48D|nr:hypothetical protein [Candidatus Protofrankia californiensis]